MGRFTLEGATWPGLLLLASPFLLIALVIAYKILLQRGVDKFYQIMHETNEKYGTAFPARREDVQMVLGTRSDKGILVFDRPNKKIGYVTRSGKSVEILDFDFIRTWTVVWMEGTSARTTGSAYAAYTAVNTTISKVHMRVTTNDLKRPIINIPIPSIAYGDEWEAKLRILLSE